MKLEIEYEVKEITAYQVIRKYNHQSEHSVGFSTDLGIVTCDNKKKAEQVCRALNNTVRQEILDFIG